MKLEGALCNEVGLVVLGVLDHFVEGFHDELAQAMGDNYFMAKVGNVLMHEETCRLGNERSSCVPFHFQFN